MGKDIEKYSRRGLQSGYLSVVVGISLVLFMLGLVLGAYFGLEHTQNAAKENIEIDLFFNPELNDSDIKMIEQELKSWEEIKSVWFVSPERALEVFQSNQKEAEEIKAIFNDRSPFPPSISFNPVGSVVDKEGLAKIKVKILDAYPKQVAEVNYDENRVSQVNLGFLQWIYLFVAIGALLTIIAFAMINNTIRLALYSKRFTIKTMQLVGAKSGFIRKPFLINSIVQGFLSAVIGVALLLAVFFALKRYMDIIASTYDLKTFLILFGVLVLLGVLISLLSTWFALNKYLRKRLDNLY
ncbi:MAG TPA: permease-like cell division protein FtsX [Brumimicrobium sp.]|nr:permease-like cell division protein FtsX [Brumimicrobium sp.]